ncbi:MAG: AAA family ATPase [Coriobacteriia bacterium]|nr:AAA family ATPase [Coriobacteriia bacterium]
MRLKRIDAIRFGALESTSLPDLGDGLTVVFGPNECGKSTYTALVRHVLFGFPMGKGKAGERFYKPVAGDRAARLVFADETGEWAVERVEGKHGGPVTVTARHGAERPRLLDELVGDLTEQAYRVVFGFGLDEMDSIENGDDRYLGARLYAAGTGLETNPLDVREALQKSAEALFAPRARVSAAVNVAVGEMATLRDRIRVLEAEASSYADDQARAHGLADELEPLRRSRDEADARVRALDRGAQRARDLALAAAELAAGCDEAQRRLASLQAAVESAAPDDRVLAVAPELEALLEEQSGFRQRLEALRGLESSAGSARSRLATLASLPDAAVDSVEHRTYVDSWALRRGALEGELQAAQRQAEHLEARAREYSAPAAAPIRSIGPVPLVSLGALFVGTGFVLGGLYSSYWPAVALGALVLLGAVAYRFMRGGAVGDLSGDARRVSADARAARAVAESARAALAAQQEAWREWLADRSLDAHGDDPVAVRALLDELRDRLLATNDVSRLEAEIRRERDLASGWADRLVGASRGFLTLPDTVDLDDVVTVAVRAREALENARAASAKRTRAVEECETTAGDLEALRGRLESQLAALEALAASHDVPVDDVVPCLEALAATEAARLESLRAEVDARSEELSTLRGRLDTEGRDAAMALARQQMEGLQSRVRQAADRYVVEALAVRLLDRARERFERERQPEVTRVAASVFASMTNGRYTDVRVPLSGEGIQVVTHAGGLKPSGELSRGTAEQLYLALRVGFLASLKTGASLPVLMDDVVVNFDAERREGAAAAIAELARERQVIFFTCHEETAAVLAKAVPGHTAVSLDRCEIKG